MARRLRRYSAASAGDRRSGRETISMSGTPARLKSTRLALAVSNTPALVRELADVLLQVEALDPDAARGGRRASISSQPSSASGASYWLI